MKVTIHVKLVNSKFDQKLADEQYNGQESEENMKILWEDEFVIAGDVTDLKVKNNAVYHLRGLLPDDSEFHYEIPDMTIVECSMADGSITQIPVSKKLISKTEKTQDKNGVRFTILLKSSRKHINPMDGVYILLSDFPKELL